MKTIFIADAHIKDIDSTSQRLLCSFIDSIKNEISSLIILGDLFDFWFGLKGVIPDRYMPILNKLFELSRSGVEITYAEGNHDFFMGPFFKDVLRASIYPCEIEMDFNGRRGYLAHGDCVNKKDYGYRMLRSLLRSRPFYLFASALPPFLLFKLASLSSHTSRNYLGKGKHLDRIFMDFARKKWDEGFDIVVLSHSHSPQFLSEDNGRKLYINIGDWIENMTYLEYEDGAFNLKRFGTNQGQQPL